MKNIVQVKIILVDSKPLIWHRLYILSTLTFWDLHVVIRDSFGWTNDHLHMF